jgi:putative DNA primase/helicase
LQSAARTGNARRPPAFTDRGDKLSTDRSDDQVAHDMVAMASARGWREIELKGSEEFRRVAWVAKEAGIRALAKAVSRELLKDPKLQRRFEDIVAEHLRDRPRAGQPLPAVKLRGERAAARERDSHREPEMVR